MTNICDVQSFMSRREAGFDQLFIQSLKINH